LSKNGFINYFGLQRFGTRKTNTHQVGRHILKNEFEEAYKLLLIEDEPNLAIKEAKIQFLEDVDTNKILKLIPRREVPYCHLC